MCCMQHLDFGHYKWYLDKNVVSCSSQLMISYTNLTENQQYSDNPNKYKAQETCSNYRFNSGEITVNIKFLTEAESMVKPPNPKIIRIHTAFAHILGLSGTIYYFDKLEQSSEQLRVAH